MTAAQAEGEGRTREQPTTSAKAAAFSKAYQVKATGAIVYWWSERPAVAKP